MRPIHLARLEELTPVVVLTRAATRPALDTVTVIPISREPLGVTSEVWLGVENGLTGPMAARLDEVMTLPIGLLDERLGYLLPDQERELARAVVLAFDLELPVFSWR